MFSRRNDLPESRDSTNDSQPTNCFPHSTMRPVLPPFPLFLLSSRHYTVFYKLLSKSSLRFCSSIATLVTTPPFFSFFIFHCPTINHRLLFSFHPSPPPPSVVVLFFESSVSLAAFRIDRVIDTLDRTPPPRPVSRKGTKWVEEEGKKGGQKRRKKKRGRR